MSSEARSPQHSHAAGDQLATTPLQADELHSDLPFVLPAVAVVPDDIVDVIRAPKKAHPGFWMSLLWCLLFLSVTQMPGSFIAVGEITLGMRDFSLREDAKQKEIQAEKAKEDAVAPEGLVPEPSDRAPEPSRPPPFQLDMKLYMLDLFRSSFVREALMHALAITEIIVVLFSWVVIRLMVGRDWKRKLALQRPGMAHVVLAVIGFPALAMVGNGAYLVLTKVCGVPGMESLLSRLPGVGDIQIPYLQQLMEAIKSWPLPISILIIGVGPGIGEELWCRGFLGRGLVGRYGVVAGIALTSLFFGLIHVDPAQGLMAMLMGICLHYVYQTTRSLWLSMLLHFLNNSLSVVLLRFPTLDAVDQEPTKFLPLYVASLVLVAAIGYAYYQCRARFGPASNQTMFLWRPDFPGVEYPPAESGTVVVHPMPSALALSAVGLGLVCFAASCVLAAQQLNLL